MTQKLTLFMESTKKEPEETIAEIQRLLRRVNMRNVMMTYDNSGEVCAVNFTLLIKDQVIPYRLPANHKSLWRLAQEGKTKYIKDEKQARRVAWRQVYRWIEAQLAMVETQMVEVEEIFLPYMMVNEEQTVYDKMLSSGFAGYLTSGTNNIEQKN